MKIKKIIKFFIILFILIIGGVFLYVKLSPKITINSANNITLYDKDNNVFFKGSEKKEWVTLDEISSYLVDSTIYTEDKEGSSNFNHLSIFILLITLLF